MPHFAEWHKRPDYMLQSEYRIPSIPIQKYHTRAISIWNRLNISFQLQKPQYLSHCSSDRRVGGLGRKININFGILAFKGSCDAVVVMYTDVLRPTIDRHPIELLRRPDVRSIGIGSILLEFDGTMCCLLYRVVDWKIEISSLFNLHVRIQKCMLQYGWCFV